MKLGLARFFFFYSDSRQFQWGSEVVSVRMGCRLTMEHQCFAWLETWNQTNRLHIEDPFILDRNLNCVLGTWQEGGDAEVASVPSSLVAFKIQRSASFGPVHWLQLFEFVTADHSNLRLATSHGIGSGCSVRLPWRFHMAHFHSDPRSHDRSRSS